MKKPRKFLTPIDLASVKHDNEVFNSQLARGEIKNPEQIVRIHNIKCGCGVQGCTFVYAERNSHGSR